jgi:hypothetical protein
MVVALALAIGLLWVLGPALRLVSSGGSARALLTPEAHSAPPSPTPSISFLPTPSPTKDELQPEPETHHLVRANHPYVSSGGAFSIVLN